MAEPTYSFTIPSLHDGLALDCRIFHPKVLPPDSKPDSEGHNAIRGAIVAHPYAPLGGSYDDSVVQYVTESLLEKAFIVCTFNFRGAGGSEGRTSWSGKPEIDDFASIVGLMVYYLHSLGPPADPSANPFAVSTEQANPPMDTSHSSSRRTVQLLLAGYSFGSLVLTRLPTVDSIVQQIETASKGTSAAEIFLRARALALRTVKDPSIGQTPPTSRGRGLSLEAAAMPQSPQSRASPVTIGGDESEALERRRRSRDARASAEIVRELPGRIRNHIRRRSSNTVKSGGSRDDHNQHTNRLSSAVASPNVSVSYLLISPVLLPLTTSLVPPGVPSLTSALFGSHKASVHGSSGFAALDLPTLVVFGEYDNFTSSKRLRQWAERLQKERSKEFQWAQVDGAGHFWREGGVMRTLQTKVMTWIDDGLS